MMMIIVIENRAAIIAELAVFRFQQQKGGGVWHTHRPTIKQNPCPDTVPCAQAEFRASPPPLLAPI